MIWFIAISGFQYCMGSDIVIYMKEYDYTTWQDVSLDAIFGFNNRQLGWIFLVNICKIISNDFVFLKIIQASFVNIVFFIFFKKQSESIFTCILFYAIFLYLDFNFNVLRQSIAVAIFLLGYKYYIDKSWLKYYMFVFFAIMFHNSAVILILLPLFRLININDKSLNILSVFIVLFYLGTMFFPLTSIFLNNITIFMDSDITKMGEVYLTSDKYGQNTGGIITFLIMLILYLWIIFFNYRNNLYKSTADFIIFFIFIFILAINSTIPIFARFNFFYMPILISSLSNFIMNFPKIKLAENLRMTFIILIITFLIYPPIKGLFSINTDYNDKQIVQFYPYYSIFDKKTSPDRDRYFDAY
jgi:hypothetical protein